MYLRALLPLLLSATTCSAQFVLEHTYPNAATHVSDKQLFMVELEDLGQRYVLFNKTTKTITFFGMDHVQVQLIDLSAVPDVDGFGGDQILYITQYLFDLDPGIELMYIAAGGSGPVGPSRFHLDPGPPRADLAAGYRTSCQPAGASALPGQLPARPGLTSTPGFYSLLSFLASWAKIRAASMDIRPMHR